MLRLVALRTVASRCASDGPTRSLHSQGHKLGSSLRYATNPSAGPPLHDVVTASVSICGVERLMCQRLRAYGAWRWFTKLSQRKGVAAANIHLPTIPKGLRSERRQRVATQLVSRWRPGQLQYVQGEESTCPLLQQSTVSSSPLVVVTTADRRRAVESESALGDPLQLLVDVPPAAMHFSLDSSILCSGPCSVHSTPPQSSEPELQ